MFTQENHLLNIIITNFDRSKKRKTKNNIEKDSDQKQEQDLKENGYYFSVSCNDTVVEGTTSKVDYYRLLQLIVQIIDYVYFYSD